MDRNVLPVADGDELVEAEEETEPRDSLPNPELPSQSEIDAKIAEQNLDGELVKKDGHIRKRLNGYPSIQEQLDLQYWDQVNGTTKWKEAIAQVKSDNPKP